MANTKSSKKDILKIERNRLRNQAIKSRLKTLRSKALQSLETEGADSAAAVKVAAQAFDTAVTKGVIHKNTAARRKSRLQKRLNQAAAK